MSDDDSGPAFPQMIESGGNWSRDLSVNPLDWRQVEILSAILLGQRVWRKADEWWMWSKPEPFVVDAALILPLIEADYLRIDADLASITEMGRERLAALRLQMIERAQAEFWARKDDLFTTDDGTPTEDKS